MIVCRAVVVDFGPGGDAGVQRCCRYCAAAAGVAGAAGAAGVAVAAFVDVSSQ